MKPFRTTTGPFLERPYFTDQQIESTCLDALRSVQLLPDIPQPIRIDRFVEKKFVSPSYEPLPDGVLGMTKFGKDGVQAIIIAEALDQDQSRSSERRIRTTLAHEAGHCLFHTYLFALSTPGRSLFGDFSEPDKPKVLCRDEGVAGAGSSYNGHWWEYQANKAIGALLLPTPLVDAALSDLMLTSGLGFHSFDHSRSEEAVRLLAEVFDVNPAVARIRLSELYPIDSRQQPML
jgi:hypothetical protein